MRLQGRRKSKNVDDQRHPLGKKYIAGMNRIEGDNIANRQKQMRDLDNRITKDRLDKAIEKVKKHVNDGKKKKATRKQDK